MDAAIPLEAEPALPLVRIVLRDPAPPKVDPNEPSVIVDPAIYREAEERLRRDPQGEVRRVARRLRSLVDPPRSR